MSNTCGVSDATLFCHDLLRASLPHESHRSHPTLQDVAANSDKNKMGTDNVAMVFAPNILRPQAQQDQSSLLNDATAVKDILRLLIEELQFMRVGVMRSKKTIGAPAGGDTVRSRHAAGDHDSRHV